MGGFQFSVFLTRMGASRYVDKPGMRDISAVERVSTGSNLGVGPARGLVPEARVGGTCRDVGSAAVGLWRDGVGGFCGRAGVGPPRPVPSRCKVRGWP